MIPLDVLRRSLHQNAEIGLELPVTQQLLESSLEGLPIEWRRGTALSSLTGVLRGREPGPTVLLRADMDALPIRERTGLDFSSSGQAMHACGHDLHMASLVGAARLLAVQQSALKGNIIFAFQPGEEGFGGARLMLDEGLLHVAGTPVSAAYALHVISDLPHGKVFCRPGTTMAGYATLDVTLKGRGAHGGRPHEGMDPVPVAAEIITGLHSYVDRRFNPFDPVVITVGEIHAGVAPNVVADEVVIRAGIRAFSEVTAHRTGQELPLLIEGIANAYGIEVEITYQSLMRPTVNDSASAEIVARTATKLFGADRYVSLEFPRSGSEDFSEILDQVPGAFVYMGASFPGAVKPVGNHSPQSVFDDSVLDDAASLLASLALNHVTPDAATCGS